LAGDYGYVVGGFGDDSSCSELVMSVLDAKTQRWMNVDFDANGYDNRAGHSTVVHKGTMYVYGGEIVGSRLISSSIITCSMELDDLVWNELELAEEPDDLTEEDPEVPQVEVVIDKGPPTLRAWHSAVVVEIPSPEEQVEGEAEAKVGPQMLVFGGQNEETEPLSDVWLLNLEAKKWFKPETSGDLPDARAYHTTTSVGGPAGNIVLYGGSDGDNRFDQVHVLSTLAQADAEGTPASFQWTRCQVDDFIPAGRCWHSAVTRVIEVDMEELKSMMVHHDLDEEDPGQTNDEEENADSELLESLRFRTLTLIFGGHSKDGVLPTEVLSFDHIKCEWEKIEAEGVCPKPRFGHDSIFSEEHQTMVSVGGIAADGKIGDIISLDMNATKEEIAEVEGGAKLGWGRQKAANGREYEGSFRHDKRHGKGMMTYSEDDIEGTYKGDWINGLRSGEGICVYACGSEYTGEWSADDKCGSGVLTYLKGPLTGKSDGEGIEGIVEDRYQGQWSGDQRHGEGEQTYVNGDKFVGLWASGMKNGYGTMYYGDGAVYKGAWSEGMCSGVGVLTTAKKDVYEGTFKMGVMHGIGVCTYADGSRYDGMFKQGMCNGAGTCKYSNRDEYVGKWRSNMRNGRGVCNYAAGHEYQGTWSADMRSGKGVCKYKNGDKYEGQWANDVKEGDGEYVKQNGTRYEGEWEGGVRCGQGECVFYAGFPPQQADTYKGSWLSDMRIGKGTLTYLNGDVYEGSWEDDLQRGQGRLTYVNGNVYEGDWENGRQDGKGILEKVQGEPSVYKGLFANGVFQGQGIAEYSSADEYDGKWNEGVRSGMGSMEYKNGDIYEGQWENDMRQGTGTATYADGHTYEGEWKNDKRHVRKTNWKEDDWKQKERS
jgi:hypothetical protein